MKCKMIEILNVIKHSCNILLYLYLTDWSFNIWDGRLNAG